MKGLLSSCFYVIKVTLKIKDFHFLFNELKYFINLTPSAAAQNHLLERGGRRRSG
jgi:hypothetical protein